MQIAEARTVAGLETKFMAVSRLAESGEGGVVSGYASLFGIPDQGGDMVEPGAFARSLARLAEAERRVKFLWQHDPARPIGVWHEVVEDDTGLRVRGEILAAVSQGRDALALLQAGAIDGLSIGYRTIRAETGRDGTRRLLELDLWEVSLVTFPMLPTARAMIGAPAAPDFMELALAEALAG